MSKLQSEFLFRIRSQFSTSHQIGQTPYGARSTHIFNGGTFEGPKLRGTVVDGLGVGLIRADGALMPDVRVTLQTDDDKLIYMAYRGIRCGPVEVMERVARGEEVDSSEYYLRNVSFFETESAKYGWLNRIISVGVGKRMAEEVVYDVYQIL